MPRIAVLPTDSLNAINSAPSGTGTPPKTEVAAASVIVLAVAVTKPRRGMSLIATHGCCASVALVGQYRASVVAGVFPIAKSVSSARWHQRQCGGMSNGGFSRL